MSDRAMYLRTQNEGYRMDAAAILTRRVNARERTLGGQESLLA
jgi:hypothetical protein